LAANPSKSLLHRLGPAVHVGLCLAWFAVQARLLLIAVSTGLATFFSGTSHDAYEVVALHFLVLAILPRVLFSTVPILAIPYALLAMSAIQAAQDCIAVNAIPMDNATGQALGEAIAGCRLLLVDAGLLVVWWFRVLVSGHRPTTHMGLIVKWWK
jgi:hypothetical protein